MPASVTVGDPIPIELANVDDHDHAFFHPGASNGCGAFRFRVSFASKALVYREDELGMGCGQGLVPARWIVIKKGESLRFEQATDMPVITGPDNKGVAASTKHLAPGAYVLRVVGADIDVKAPIALTAKKTP